MNDEYFSKLSPWFDSSNLTDLYKILKIGDIVQMTGSGLPTQWAICSKVKQGSAVVIYRDTLSRMKDEQSTRSIQKYGLAALIGKRQIRINNVNDNHFPVEPSRNQIVYKAEYFLQFPHRVKEVPGFICTEEHRRLVTLCRYDMKCLKEVEAVNGRKSDQNSLDHEPPGEMIFDSEIGDPISNSSGSPGEMEASRVRSTSAISDAETRIPNGKCCHHTNSVEKMKAHEKKKITGNFTSPMTIIRNRLKKNSDKQRCATTNSVIARLLKSKDSEHEKLKTFVLNFSSYDQMDNWHPSSKEYVSRWLNGPELKYTLFEGLNVGDLLEIRRGGYSRWSVCLRVLDDDAIVAHRTDDSKPNSTEERIVITSLMNIAGDFLVRVNNSRDIKFHVLSKSGILFKVNYYIKFPDKIGDYDLVDNNCEHFATVCRYGVKCSISGKIVEVVESVADRRRRIEREKYRKAIIAARARKKLTDEIAAFSEEIAAASVGEELEDSAAADAAGSSKNLTAEMDVLVVEERGVFADASRPKNLTAEMALSVVAARGLAVGAAAGGAKIKEAAVTVVEDLFKAAVDDFLNGRSTNKSNNKKELCA